MNLDYKIIKHNLFKDVAFYVYSEDKWSESTVLKGMWLNQGMLKTWQIKEEQIQIMYKDINNWLVLEENPIDYIIGKKCLRKTNAWLPIPSPTHPV